MLRLAAASVSISSVLGADTGLSACPGEGARHADRLCSRNEHRVCARVLAESGGPLTFEAGSLWTITGQQAINVTEGDSLCLSLGDVAAMVEAGGCEQVHIRCNATDLSFVSANATNATAVARTCLEEQCGGFVHLAQVVLAEVREELPRFEAASGSHPLLPWLMVLGALAFVASRGGVKAVRESMPMWEAYIDDEDGDREVFVSSNTVEFIPLAV